MRTALSALSDKFDNIILVLPASGLLYVSELIEEHSRPAKQIGQRGIYVCHIHTPFDNASFNNDATRP